jgi:hypothetical protein
LATKIKISSNSSDIEIMNNNLLDIKTTNISDVIKTINNPSDIETIFALSTIPSYVFLILLLFIGYFDIAKESYSSKYNKYGLNGIIEFLFVSVIFVSLIFFGINIENLSEFIILLAYDILMLSLMFFVSKARFEKQKARNPLSDFIKED